MLTVLVIVVVFVSVGALAGYLWFQIWDPPTGVAYERSWVVGEQGLRSSFSATGWFVVLAAVSGSVLGFVAGAASRGREVATLIAVVVGSAAATYMMWRMGQALSPPDPDVLARSAPDLTPFEGRIAVGGWSPFLALPASAVLGLLVALILIADRPESSAAAKRG